MRRSQANRIKAVIFPPRQHPRVYLTTDVRVEGHDLTFTARSVQLGTSGMSLEHAGQLAMAYPVLLTFALPSGCPVRVGAVVWWKTKELVGLRFDPRDHNRYIQEWVQRSAVAKSEDAATVDAGDVDSQIGHSNYA
ncbi:MAG: PilZ domain-containing protein [Acidobacteriia bacterium]|nr:PilZ domain-containing protein [Terriglobia bacterium]